MVVTTTVTAGHAPFLVDVDDLDSAMLRPAVHLSTLEHRQMPSLLGVHMPELTYTRRSSGTLVDEHRFVDTVAGSAVRLVIRADNPAGEITAAVGEAGQSGLWDRIIVLCREWDSAGRPDPVVWCGHQGPGRAVATEHGHPPVEARLV